MNDTSTDRPSDPFREKIERLLLRHEESRRTVALLQEQINQLTAERDSLQSRLQVASQRIESVLQRLPTVQTNDELMLAELNT
jgi:chromosome segregation ATPase